MEKRILVFKITIKSKGLRRKKGECYLDVTVCDMVEMEK